MLNILMASPFIMESIGGNYGNKSVSISKGGIEWEKGDRVERGEAKGLEGLRVRE